MEKKIQQVTAYIEVASGTRDIITFVASDGKEFLGFSAEKDCIEYENKLEKENQWSAIDHLITKSDDVNLPEYWDRANTEEELEMIKQRGGFYDKVYLYINDKDASPEMELELAVGEWISAIRIDGGDSRDDVKFYTLTYIRYQIELFLGSFKK